MLLGGLYGYRPSSTRQSNGSFLKIIRSSISTIWVHRLGLGWACNTGWRARPLGPEACFKPWCTLDSPPPPFSVPTPLLAGPA